VVDNEGIGMMEVRFKSTAGGGGKSTAGFFGRDGPSAGHKHRCANACARMRRHNIKSTAAQR
jgi:hypothetical protein